MHEKLKFKIHLSEERGADQEWGYQPIFSEAQYGTHYVVNARFVGNEDVSGALNLNTIHFYLQNYTGSVTIGLEDFSLIEECTKEYQELREPHYPDCKVYKIILFARGFNTNLRHCHKITDNDVLKVFKAGDILVTEVIYLPITKKLTFWDDSSKYGEALYLDPVYQLRDGEHVILTKIGKDMIGYMQEAGLKESDDGRFDFGSISSFDQNAILTGPSRHCKASISMAI
ncbi:MAG: hypothetical protein RLO12_09760 [Fulvivirga sp.]